MEVTESTPESQSPPSLPFISPDRADRRPTFSLLPHESVPKDPFLEPVLSDDGLAVLRLGLAEKFGLRPRLLLPSATLSRLLVFEDMTRFGLRRGSECLLDGFGDEEYEESVVVVVVVVEETSECGLGFATGQDSLLP